MKDNSKILKEITGARVQTIRKKLHMNQDELAKHLNVSNGTVSAVEKGHIFPSFKVIYHLAKKFNVNLFFLVFGAGEMFHQDQVNKSLTGDFPREQALFLENFIRDFNRSELFRHSIMAYCKKFRLKYSKLMQKESQIKNDEP
jgi:transcriptional regulator with XRE-family HTH domain